MLTISATGTAPQSRTHVPLNLGSLALPPLPGVPVDLLSNAGALMRTTDTYLGLIDTANTAMLLGPMTTASTTLGAGGEALTLGSLPSLPSVPLNNVSALLPATLLDNLGTTDMPGLPVTTTLPDLEGSLISLLGGVTLPTAVPASMPAAPFAGLFPAVQTLPPLDMSITSQAAQALGELAVATGVATPNLASILGDVPPSALALSSLQGGASLQGNADASSAGSSAMASVDTASSGPLLSIASGAANDPATLVTGLVSQFKLLG